MLIAYLCSKSLTPVYFILYDPDKSTKFIDATLLTSVPGLVVSRYIMKIQWERVDSSFFGVLHVIRLVSPLSNNYIESSRFLAKWTDKFWSLRSPFPVYNGLTAAKSSSIFNLSADLSSIVGSNKSYPVSLYICKYLILTLI